MSEATNCEHTDCHEKGLELASAMLRVLAARIGDGLCQETFITAMVSLIATVLKDEPLEKRALIMGQIAARAGKLSADIDLGAADKFDAMKRGLHS